MASISNTDTAYRDECAWHVNIWAAPSLSSFLFSPSSPSSDLLVSALGLRIFLDLVVGVTHKGDQEIKEDDGIADAVEEVDEGGQYPEVGGVERLVVKVAWREGSEGGRKEKRVR